jgi:formylmethanofuran dehydrogenase subunit E
MTKNLSESFLCWYCEKNLTDNRYVIKDGFAVCLSCFEEKYSNHCFKCNQIIGIETQVKLHINKFLFIFLIQGSLFQDKTWHNTCFTCSICNTSLLNKKFAYRNEKLYCRHCFIIEFAERCYRCNRPLEPSRKFFLR